MGGNGNSDQWKWLSRLEIPQRCKLFLCLLLNHRLHTSTLLPPTCPFCHQHDALLHMLRDCPRSRNLWLHLVAPQHQHAFFSCSLRDWMLTFLQHPWSNVNHKDTVLFAATVWLLWKDRITWVCDGPSFPSENLLHRLGTLADDYGRLLHAEHSDPSPALRHVSWCFFWNQPPSKLHLRLVANTSHNVFPKL
ncbi:hypothetical protein RJT34_33355 [Clitoria ternatea]|uniref:Reverse transcriptase zinc-binding domain-containing protein n=1 Tax=Clitoria ternatea TaxID=43366 RepID=A0AAN9I4K0_CLITE